MSTTEKPEILEKLIRFLRKAGVSAGSRVLVGLSGGADSTALLFLMKEASADLGIEICGLYIDHGIRAEQERRKELEWIGNIEEDTGIQVFRRFCTPGVIETYAARSGSGIEAAARHYRYRIFRRVMERFGFNYLALGHTLDDQIETVVIRFFQGSGPEGLKGIPRQRESAGGRGRVIRPLLETKKEEILSYLGDAGVGFITDSTNTHLDFLRNRVRHELLPAAVAVFPAMNSVLAETGEKYGKIADFIRSETEKRLPVQEYRNSLGVSFEVFKKAHPVLQEQAVYTLADAVLRSRGAHGDRDQLLHPEVRVPRVFVREICSIAVSKHKDGTVHAGHGVHFYIEKGLLKACPDVVKPEKKGYLLIVKEDSRRDIYRSGFQIAESLISSAVKTDTWIYEHEKLFPLLIRSWRYGDRIKIRGGTKEVRKLFQEWNVPDSMKWIIPIVESPCGIEAVFGSFFDFPNRRAIEPGSPPKQKKKKVLVFSYTDDKDGIF